jgi:hypothetical protein
VTLHEPRPSFIRQLVVKDVWSWGGMTAVRCPTCGCTPDGPCTIVLTSECGEGSCVPAGAYGLETCSSCHAREGGPLTEGAS